MSFFPSLPQILHKNQQSPINSVEDQSKAEQLLVQADREASELVAKATENATLITQSAKSNLEGLQQQLQKLKDDFAKKQSYLLKREAKLLKKEQRNQQYSKSLAEHQQSIQTTQQQLITKLTESSGVAYEQAVEDIIHDFEQRVEKSIFQENQQLQQIFADTAEQISQDLLIRVMKWGAINYKDEYTSPIVSFTSSQEERLIVGRNQENLTFITDLTTVEITWDQELHQLKLYCFNTIEREKVRVLLERLKKKRHIQPNIIKKVYEEVERDLNKKMLAAGKYLCHQLNIYRLPNEIIQTLGMFLYRYSYGQNMITHTLEEAKIGIALAQELGANADIVRLGCLFHDIGKVLYDLSPNHVEAGVEYLRSWNMPEAVIACVAESHEDIPFSSIESKIVHTADAISGARPGARFDDYEGFIKHQQGLIDISMEKKGVEEAFVINGGREVRVSVNPSHVSDQQMSQLAENIRDEVQEFSTYPGSIVVNVVREVQSTQMAGE